MIEKIKFEDPRFSKHLKTLKTIKNSESYSQIKLTINREHLLHFRCHFIQFRLDIAAEIGEITLYDR